MNKSLKIKIAGLCGEVNTRNSLTSSYLKTKFIHFLSGQNKIDLKIEINKKHPFFYDKTLPRLIFKGGNFHFLPEKDSKNILGILKLKEKHCQICDFEDKSLLIHSVLLCFAIFLENSRGLILHASAAFKDREGFLFPGQANAGKSTIIKQIKNLVPLTEEWVGVKKEGNSFFLYGIPYQNSQNNKKKVKQILFPKKGEKVSFKRLNAHEAAKRLLSNCLFSTIHSEIVGRVLETVEELAKQVPCYEFEFPLNVWLDREILKEKIS